MSSASVSHPCSIHPHVLQRIAEAEHKAAVEAREECARLRKLLLSAHNAGPPEAGIGRLGILDSGRSHRTTTEHAPVPPRSAVARSPAQKHVFSSASTNAGASPQTTAEHDTRGVAEARRKLLDEAAARIKRLEDEDRSIEAQLAMLKLGVPSSGASAEHPPLLVPRRPVQLAPPSQEKAEGDDAPRAVRLDLNARNAALSATRDLFGSDDAATEVGASGHAKASATTLDFGDKRVVQATGAPEAGLAHGERSQRGQSAQTQRFKLEEDEWDSHKGNERQEATVQSRHEHDGSPQRNTGVATLRQQEPPLLRERDAQAQRKEEIERQERERQERERMERERMERERQEREERERQERQEGERAQQERQERERSERQERERQERERQEAERQVAERREAERREAERQEAERQEAERREAERQEAERQKVKRKEAERQEAERQEAERQEQQQREEQERQEKEAQEEAARREREAAERQLQDRRDSNGGDM